MQGDYSRNTFRPERGYSAVRMQQGRVSVDADWNEEGDIRAYLERTALTDVIGPTGAPEPGGFGVAVAADGTLRVSPGHYYVRGILSENVIERILPDQPFPPAVALPTDPGVYLAYLDVWERLVTYVRDPELLEVALDGPDTAARQQVVWQVGFERVGDTGDTVACSDFGEDWTPIGTDSSGRLRARAETPASDANECLVPPGAGYRRQENQLYRVEIHDAGAPGGTATYKWSRENGSVLARLTDIDADVLVIDPPGRDENLGWAPGNWVELSDEGRVLRGEPGVMVRLGPVDGDRLTVADWGPGGALTMVSFDAHATVRRWDSAGVLPLTATGFLPLEDGVEIEFDANPAHTEFQTGDYWSFPARTATGTVAWPLDTADDPVFTLRHGTTHAYARLALLSWDGTDWTLLFDCRDIFPPLTGLLTLLHAGGDGQESLPGQPLSRALRVATFRGRFPVSGVRVLFTADGAGLAAATIADLPTADATHEAVTGATGIPGIAECFWQLENDLAKPVQSLEARLLDAGGLPQAAEIRFVGSLSLASGVFYETDPNCGNLTAQGTVQTAVTRLSRIASIFALSGDGQSLGPNEGAAPLRVIVGSPCGPIAGATVRFAVTAGASLLNGNPGPIDVTTNAQGIATVNWQVEPSVPFHAVEATLTGGFEAATPPTVASFTAVVRQGAGETQETCCSNSVGPNGRFQSLREAVETLIQAELRPDVSICLLPGDHAIEETLLLVPPDGQPWNVEITGSGRGTRLVLEAGVTVHAEGLASLALRHFDLHAKQTDRPVQIFSVGDLTLEDCQWEERVFSNSLVSISGVQRMRLSDTTLHQEVPDDPSRAVALAISDPQAETSWDNCRFIGQVVLYAREFAPTEANVFHQIATISNANELELGEPLNNLRASGCHFTRIVVDSAFSADIFQGNRPQPYRSIHLSDCLFPNSENQVLAPHFTLDAARFQIDEGDSVLLTGVSRTAIYTGNASPGRDFRIVAGVPGGLIGINIQHVANLLTMSDP